MANATSFWSMAINDNTLTKNGTPEHAAFEIPVTTLNAGNVAAQTTLIAALKAAILPIILGNVRQEKITLIRTIPSESRPANTLAQRENKWLLRAHGTTTFDKFSASIPTSDLALLPDGSEFLDLAGTEGAALKAAFDAVARNPHDQSELLVLDSVQFVGRNT